MKKTCKQFAIFYSEGDKDKRPTFIYENNKHMVMMKNLIEIIGKNKSGLIKEAMKWIKTAKIGAMMSIMTYGNKSYIIRLKNPKNCTDFLSDVKEVNNM